LSRIVIVTGASRGIGAACARSAAVQGFDVCVNYLTSHTDAENVAAAVRDTGRRAITVQADMRSEEDIVRLFTTVDNELGLVDALINNAGSLGHPSRVVDLAASDIDDLFTANVTSYFVCSREAVLRMSTSQGGHGGAIVNIASVASRIGGAGLYVHYAASKGAIDTLTIGLAREVASEGIRVNAVRPGMIHSEIRVRAGLPDGVDEIAPTIPMKRYGDPEEVAAAALWLLSDSASYVTGTLLDVSGAR